MGTGLVGPETFSLDGKVALVTGATKGLGRAIVEGYARAGADVVVSSRKQQLCDEVAAGIEASTGRRAVPIACHVGHWDELDTLVERAYDELGHIDVLVNNAGMSPLYDSLSGITEDNFDKVIGVNLKGPFRLCALVGERMAAGDGGSIINVSSVGAIRPQHTALPYCAAKAGLEALTIGFAQAYAPKVRVNTLMPGPFLTDIAQNWTPELLATNQRMSRLGRIAESEEIVGAALLLATQASAYMTGTIIRVDGGIAT